MPRNASGSYTLPSGNPVVSGTLIDATWANNTLADLGNEVTDSLSRSGEGAMLAPLRITDGVQATPSLAFSNEPSSGLYRAGSNEWWAVAAGVQNLRFTNTGLTTRAAAGAVGTPSIAAFNDTDTGIYFPGANELAIATGGALRLSVDSAGTISIPGSFGVDTNTLYVDAPNNRVGIGTSSPAYKLDVDGAARVNNLLWFTPTSGSLGIGASGTNFEIYNGPGAETRFVVSNAGDVGIGTASPGSKLHVVQTAASEGLRIDGDGSGYAFVVNGGTDRTSRIRALSIGAAYVSTTPPTNGLIVDGNVGIGTASPSTKLDVRSGYITSGTASSNLGTRVLAGFYTDGALSCWGTEYSSGGPVMGYAVWPSTLAADSFVSASGITIERGAYTISANNHRWYIGASQTVSIGSAVSMTQAMTLSAAGNLGVGTTSPAARLDVTGTFNGLQSRFGFTAGRGLEISTAAVGGTNEAASILNAKGSGSGALVIQTDSTDRLRVDNNGNVGVGTTGTISNRLEVACASGADRDIFLAGVTGASNGLYVQWNHATTKTHVRIANIPTSSAGLPSGTLWNDAGTIKIA